MKKYFLIFLSVLLLVFSICGCSNKNTETRGNEETEKVEEDSSSNNADTDSNYSHDEIEKDTKFQTESKDSDSKDKKTSQSDTNSSSLKVSEDNSKENKYNIKETTSQNANVSKEKDSDLYSSKLGFTINFPKSWKNLYTVNETEDSLYVLFKQTTPGDYGQGILFAIIKKVDDSDELTIDTIGDKRYIVAKDILYIIGGPTDINFSPESPDFQTFEDMHNQCADVINTIKVKN